MIESIEVIVTSEAMAKAAVRSVFSADYPDLVCVRYATEQGHPIAQSAPAKRKRTPEDPKGPTMIQDPTPEPLPGRTTYRLFYEAS